MPDVPVGPAARDLAALLDVSRRPEAQQRSRQRDQQPDEPRPRRRRRQRRTRRPPRQIRAARASARGDERLMAASGGAMRAFSRASIAAATSATGIGAQTPALGRPAAAALVVAVARRRSARPRRSRGSHGPLRAGSVGPNSATTGVPTAAAMCVGPVSPDTIRRALRERATQIAQARRRRHDRRAVRGRDDLLGAASPSPGPQSTTDGSPWRVAKPRAPSGRSGPAASACSARPRRS